ncbi:MAG TPA: hypothetical protein VFW78_02630 [Bacteroidia bacterium]|nr:hypothetical protein [Bacteroidia bacterium]
MKNTLLTGIKMLIIIILVQSIRHDHLLYAAETETNTSDVVVVKGELTELKIESASPTCSGRADGIADLSITGSDYPYAISWSTGANTEDLSGLTAGSYSVAVTGNSGQVLTAKIFIADPSEFRFQNTVTQPSCFNGNNGSMELKVEGGTAPYTITCNNIISSQVMNGLSAGNYLVRVTDSNGCETSALSVLESKSEMIKFTTNDVSCFGVADGSIKLDEAALLSAKSFTWSNGAETASLDGLRGGTYQLEIEFNDGCKSQYAFAVSEPAPIMLSITSTDANCEEGGTATVEVAGGESPFLFNWSDGSEVAGLDRLDPGIYSVEVIDSRLCRASGQAKVGGVHSQMSLLLTSVSANCALDQDGSIDLYVSGGKQPYQYLWSNGSPAEDLMLIEPGDYAVTVTDAAGCSQNASISVEGPAPLTASLSEFSTGCFSNSAGLTLIPSGGVRPYQYKWSTGAATASVDGLTAGIYTGTVIDKNGCRVELSHSIAEHSEIIVSEIVTHPSGPDKSDGSIIPEVSGGIPPYIFEWSDGSSSVQRSNLSSGHYLLQITDASGCTSEFTYTLGIGYGDDNPAFVQATNPEKVQQSLRLQVATSGNGSNNPDITLKAAGDDRYTVSIFDLTGRYLMNILDEPLRSGETRSGSIHSGQLSTGVYVVKAFSSTAVATLKIDIIN